MKVIFLDYKEIRKHTLCKLGIHRYKYEICVCYEPIIETYNDPDDNAYKRTRMIGSTSYQKNILVCKYCGKEK